MFSALIDAVKKKLTTTTLDNAAYEDDKKDQAKIRKAVDKNKVLTVNNPQSTRYDVNGELLDSKGVFDADTDNFTKTNISSTAVQTVEYNPKTKDLDIQYVGGKKKYRFPDVPKQVVTEFLESPSKGKYLAYVIRPEYSTNM